jgi:histidine ammonia-lyase
MSVELSDEAKINIQKCRDFWIKKCDSSEPIYGINTGFGSLCNVKIFENLSKLQENLVKSHACGTGKSAKGSSKLMLLLKIQSLGYGHSGIQLQTVNRLSFFLMIFYLLFIHKVH